MTATVPMTPSMPASTMVRSDRMRLGKRNSQAKMPVSASAATQQQQLTLFQAPVDDRFREKLAALDVDRMTPLEALTLLAELRKEAQA